MEGVHKSVPGRVFHDTILRQSRDWNNLKTYDLIGFYVKLLSHMCTRIHVDIFKRLYVRHCLSPSNRLQKHRTFFL